MSLSVSQPGGQSYSITPQAQDTLKKIDANADGHLQAGEVAKYADKDGNSEVSEDEMTALEDELYTGMADENGEIPDDSQALIDDTLNVFSYGRSTMGQLTKDSADAVVAYQNTPFKPSGITFEDKTQSLEDILGIPQPAK